MYCPARHVGTRKVPFAFMSASVSSVRNEPCSIESIPAFTADRAARSPCTCAAVLRFKRWASTGFYRVLSAIGDTRITAGSADYRLVSRPVLEALREMR